MAREIPPVPVWKDTPSTSSPEALIALAAYEAIKSLTGLDRFLVAPDSMPAGSPILSTLTT